MTFDVKWSEYQTQVHIAERELDVCIWTLFLAIYPFNQLAICEIYLFEGFFLNDGVNISKKTYGFREQMALDRGHNFEKVFD
jgi:hypothetical protein